MQTEERVGTLRSYDPKHHAAIVHIDRGTLRRGDTIHIHAPGIDFDERVSDLREGTKPVAEASEGKDVRIHLTHRFGKRAARMREPPTVFRVNDPYKAEDGQVLAALFE
ncbi:MAG: hypothetical protein R3185_09255 [Candidatus Thermoplasmatota archaeon]|nr:hypothetical protein [Candidatus Thermoplasmatota archaeon]